MQTIAEDAGKIRPRALLFDWDNTLVDSWPTIHDALTITFDSMGMTPWTLEETKERTRLSLRDSFPALFGSRWEEARQRYLDAFRAIHLDRLVVLPGVEELLPALKEAGYYLGIVSNKTGSILRSEAQKLGWDRYLDRLVGATDATADKPHCAPVELALQGSNISAGPEVWFIGDTALDIECARNSGCVPVLLGPYDDSAAEFALHKPILAFEDCRSLFLHLSTL